MNINNIYPNEHEKFYFITNNECIRTSFSKKIYSDIDINSIRNDFPILKQKVNNKPLVWLDNAATTQKPLHVINALNTYYREYNSNVHRGIHSLSMKASNAFDEARKKICEFIGADSSEEIIFTRGTTEGINLVAQSYGETNIHENDEIILTLMEHHSNIVPWQALAKSKGAKLKIVPINSDGEIILEEYKKMFSGSTRMVAIAHVSNVLGTVNPIKMMIDTAHLYGVPVLVDGAQAVPHMRVNVREMDADFYVFSGHKCYGPTGIGVLYGKKDILTKMEPWQKGGGMIKNVTFKNTEYNELPHKFEAGTGNIAGVVGLGAAVDYMNKIGMKRIEQYEKYLTEYAMKKLLNISGLNMIGTSKDKISVLSFNVKNTKPQKAAEILNREGIALRGGHHCAQPTLSAFGVESSLRASLALYNTIEEVDFLADTIKRIF